VVAGTTNILLLEAFISMASRLQGHCSLTTQAFTVHGFNSWSDKQLDLKVLVYSFSSLCGDFTR
jgi:hypothetical protein